MFGRYAISFSALVELKCIDAFFLALVVLALAVPYPCGVSLSCLTLRSPRLAPVVLENR